ncbi:hypothetical protein [Chryseobacterium gambrini]|uniref:Uncharacterized protein n=1 Tax=Chryseobacterium gambrini TaxID=373672 RepID=A0A1N7N851_9FLAO|nr:hypothetical protein [Chryseobacterium gambrini]SIS94520.1 hypothetical protein SAMN05421785_10452 [Chryseobacterium gambrini]
MNIFQKFVFLFFLIISKFVFAQNENEFREAFTLKIAVDSMTFYQQEIGKSKYSLKIIFYKFIRVSIFLLKQK